MLVYSNQPHSPGDIAAKRGAWRTTIAVMLQVGDGVILGADSASTAMLGDNVANIYFNAEKIANLFKGLPIGLMTWGVGGLAGRSISSLAKDLRQRLTSGEPDWMVDRNAYTIEEVARKVNRFFVTELYSQEFPREVPQPSGEKRRIFDPIGFAVAGYSANQRKPEIHFVEVDDKGEHHIRQFLPPGGIGAEAKGMPEALMRLVNGYSPRVQQAMVDSGIAEQDARGFLASIPMEQLIHAGMPIQDAIDLVTYLIEVTEGFVRFIPGAPMVHSPIDIAVMTYHEGFHWVRRKHYFPPELNPPVMS